MALSGMPPSTSMTSQTKERSVKVLSSLHRTVLIFGLVSFFTDVSSEMIYPLLPIYLVSILSATPTILGLIEGVAEAVASLFKLFSGVWADRLTKRKPLILLGYITSSSMRPLIGLATTWPFVFFLRFLDRVGKGLRTTPRDALLAEVTPENQRGRAYGFHRSMDHWGAVVGPLIATGLLVIPGFKIQTVFLWAALPATFAVLILIFGLKEDQKTEQQVSKNISFFQDWKQLSSEFKRLLFSIFIFSLGQSTDAFLLLRLKQVGIQDSYIPALWAVLHIVKATSSQHLGKVSDKIGHRNMILMGWIFYAVLYFTFGFIENSGVQIILFISYGLFFGMTEGPEKALISILSPPQLKGSALGWYNMTVGLSVLPASLIFGFIWTEFSSSTAFYFGSVISIIAMFILVKNRIHKLAS